MYSKKREGKKINLKEYLQFPVTTTPSTTSTEKTNRVSLESVTVRFDNTDSNFFVHIICNDNDGAAVGRRDGFTVGLGEGRALGLFVFTYVDGEEVGLLEGDDVDGTLEK